MHIRQSAPSSVACGLMHGPIGGDGLCVPGPGRVMQQVIWGSSAPNAAALANTEGIGMSGGMGEGLRVARRATLEGGDQGGMGLGDMVEELAPPQDPLGPGMGEVPRTPLMLNRWLHPGVTAGQVDFGCGEESSEDEVPSSVQGSPPPQVLPWVSSGHQLAMGWVGADLGVSRGEPATGGLTEGPLGGGLPNMDMDLSSCSDEVGPSIPGSPLPPILPWISSHHTALVWGGLGAGCAQGDLSAGGTMDVPLRAEVLGGEMEDMYDSASTDEVWSPPLAPLCTLSPRGCAGQPWQTWGGPMQMQMQERGVCQALGSPLSQGDQSSPLKSGHTR